MSTYYEPPPFAAGFLINKWFIGLNALTFAMVGLLLSGWWRLALFLAALLGLELSGLIGRRAQFMWTNARWFRIYIGSLIATLIAFVVLTRLTDDEQIFWMCIAFGLLLPIFFLIPMSRFTKALLFPP